MKKLFITLIVIFTMPYIYRALVRRNLSRCPIPLNFYRSNGSNVNIRTIMKEPGTWVLVLLQIILFIKDLVKNVKK